MALMVVQRLKQDYTGRLRDAKDEIRVKVHKVYQ